VERACEWSRRWFEAQRDLPLAGPPLVIAADAYLKRMQVIEADAKQRFTAGVIGADDIAIIAYYRADAELAFARAKKSP
jgi:hypothetical protein